MKHSLWDRFKSENLLEAILKVKRKEGWFQKRNAPGGSFTSETLHAVKTGCVFVKYPKGWFQNTPFSDFLGHTDILWLSNFEELKNTPYSNDM